YSNQFAFNSFGCGNSPIYVSESNPCKRPNDLCRSASFLPNVSSVLSVFLPSIHSNNKNPLPGWSEYDKKLGTEIVFVSFNRRNPVASLLKKNFGAFAWNFMKNSASIVCT